MKRICLPLFLVVFLCASASVQAEEDAKPAFGQGIMVGEVTDTSAIVQVRVTKGTKLIDGDTFGDGDAMRDGDLPGAKGLVQFVYFRYDKLLNDDERFNRVVHQTEVFEAHIENDFIVRTTLNGLESGVRYICQAILNPPAKLIGIGGLPFNNNDKLTVPDIGCSFKTHPGKDNSAPVRFVLTSCMNYDKFTGSDGSDRSKGYQGEDRALGYPAAEAVIKQKPDFVIYAGDVVYYRKNPPVQTLEDMRAKWHRQNNLPRMIALHAAAPGYWMKDDWDYRANDSDPTRDGFPSHELGIKTFREQVPIVAAEDDETPTYRTHRVSKDLQLWFIEGRDYRDANKLDDDPGKSIWGDEQTAWLKQTLLASDATYKLVISPTPLVGPDDGYKNDNHTNPKGFATEGQAFKQWGKANSIWDNTFLMCGDRHWQYHSIDPTGANEFSCGAFNDENSRMGRKPGDKGSTDPAALVKQLFTSPKPTGGFLSIAIEPSEGDAEPVIRFEFYDDLGEKLYSYDK